jgi:dihydroflavonol-4-reductase
VNALVTGAGGFIGGAVTRALQRRGGRVRVLLRPGSEPNVADARDLEIVRGDLRDAEAVRTAARGCDAIFHAGALYSFAARPGDVLAVNVGGTRNVLGAARAEGVARIVYTSSIATIGGMRSGRPASESDEPTGPPPGPYKKSKWMAEALVREEARRGLDAVIVNPTFPVGEGDVKPTPTGQLVLDFLEGRMPAYVDTGMNVVDVDDVAQGHLLAFDRGERGQRYLLGNANLTMQELLQELAAIAGRSAPRIRLPHGVALALAHADAFVEGMLLRRTPRVPLEGVRTAREVMFADCSRAVRELGMPQTPVREALARAVRFFQARAARRAS